MVMAAKPQARSDVVENQRHIWAEVLLDWRFGASVEWK